MNGSSPSTPPILVTGAHRSGTTWVGRMLAAGRETAYISEPLNCWHRPGVLHAPVEQWYTYICPENEAHYLPAFEETLRLRYNLGAELRCLRSWRDVLRMARDWREFTAGRLRGRRPLLKDPFASFSIPWFVERLGCQVVVVIRHPAAFASSLKRLKWPFDFNDLLGQPLLMRARLEPFRGEMQAMLQAPDDLVGGACLLWRMLYQQAARYHEDLPGLLLVRHEDLSSQPLEGFQELYAALGLSFNRRARRAILDYSRPENPKETSTDAAHSVRLDSRANMESWKRRLGAEEVERIRRLTAPVADRYYTSQEWD